MYCVLFLFVYSSCCSGECTAGGHRERGILARDVAISRAFEYTTISPPTTTPHPHQHPHLHGFTTAAIISIPSLCRGGGSRNAVRVSSRINYAYPVHALIYVHIILWSIKYILYMYNILYIRFTCSTAHRNIIIIIIQDRHGPVKVLSAFHIIFFSHVI